MVPDVDGRVGQDLAVAVPAAVGGGTAASRMVSADLAEDLAFAVLSQLQLQVRVALAVTRCEAETPHPVDLNKGQVKLVKTERGKRKETVREVWRKAGVTVPGVWDLDQIRVFNLSNEN